MPEKTILSCFGTPAINSIVNDANVYIDGGVYRQPVRVLRECSRHEFEEANIGAWGLYPDSPDLRYYEVSTD